MKEKKFESFACEMEEECDDGADFGAFEESKVESLSLANSAMPVPASAPIASPKAPQALTITQEKPPSFDELINAQSSSGNWTNNCGSLLAKFFSDSMQNDSLFEELKALNAANVDLLWHTIIALYILEEMFDDRADEWEMISRKAKTWLK